jgi:glycine hydroxymethyltransferase
MDLNLGAHLTHGSKFTYSGRFYENYNYELVNELIDYDEIKRKLYEVKPRLLIMGYSAYSRRIDFEKVRQIVDEYNQEIEDIKRFNVLSPEEEKDLAQKCILWTDMAHFSLFVAAHLWKDKYDPTIWSDVVTTTTHKGLLGPRSSVILWNNDDYTKKINSAVFPGNIGGSNQAMTAAKAQCFINCLKPEFKVYAEQVYRNMQAIINGIKDFDKESKIRFVSGGSENHMVLLDMKGIGLTGKQAESLLESYNIICNKNMISGDLKPADCTGIRIGTPAITTRGFDEQMSFELGHLIARILLRGKQVEKNGVVDFESESIRSTVKKMLEKVGPFYQTKPMKRLLQDNEPTNPDDLA